MRPAKSIDQEKTVHKTHIARLLEKERENQNNWANLRFRDNNRAGVEIFLNTGGRRTQVYQDGGSHDAPCPLYPPSKSIQWSAQFRSQATQLQSEQLKTLSPLPPQKGSG
jgi:hypothetical protein